MAEDDLVYLLRRAATERKLATEATCDDARAVHRNLADAYDDRVRSAGPVVQPSRVSRDVEQ